MSPSSSIAVSADSSGSVSSKLGAEVAALGWLAATWAGALLGSVIEPVRSSMAGLILFLVSVGASAVGVMAGRRLAAIPLALLAFILMGNSEAAYNARLVDSAIDQEATVVGDVDALGAQSRVELKLADGRRVEAIGYSPSVQMSDLGFGDRVAVKGRFKSSTPARSWERYRHKTGSVAVEEISVIGEPAFWLSPAGLVRKRIEAGARVLPRKMQPLYLGLVIGDDRLQTPAQIATFRAVGLSHLLAVSGQNVAFVLAVVSPIIGRLPIRARLLATIGVLGCFVIVTRAEPSVLRAGCGAGIAAWAVLNGRERSGIQVLSVAAVALLLVDPFLARVVGFQLSVAASLGILLIGPVLSDRLTQRSIPGFLANPLAITVAAQIGVGPLLVMYFGPMSLASIPANLAAGWAAGLVMTLGLTVGVLAGLTISGIGHIIQFPVVVLLWWIDWVAVWSARLPMPRLGGASLALSTACAIAVGGLRWPPIRLLALICLVVVLGGSVPSPPSQRAALAPGVWWWPSEEPANGIIVVEANAPPSSIDAIVTARLGRVDVVVVTSGDDRSARLVSAIGEVVPVGRVLVPPQHRVKGGWRTTRRLSLPVRGGSLILEPSGDDRSLLVEFVAEETN